MGSGEPPTCAVPLFSPAAKIHPSVALSNDKEFRLCGGDQRSARWIGGRFLEKAT